MRQTQRTTEDPLWQLKPSAASEIVKAARASLKEPTRPVTPADGGRRLLQSDGYTNRPHTPGGQVTSWEFLQASSSVPSSRTRSGLGPCQSSAAAGGSASPWRNSTGNEAASAADVWRADEGLNPRPGSAASPGSGISSSSSIYAPKEPPAPVELRAAACRNFGSAQLLAVPPALPSSRRFTGAAQPGVPLRPNSASAGAESPAGRVVAAGTHSITAGAQSGLADSLAAPAATTEAPRWSRIGTPEAVVPADAAASSMQPSTSAALAAASQDLSLLVGRSREGLAATRPGTCSREQISRDSSRQGSRGSSRGGSRCSSNGSAGDDVLTSAGAAAESATAEAAAKLPWQQETVLAVEQLGSLPVSPSAVDAAALLKACAVLQTLLDTAEDQQHLQEWLATPAHAAATPAAAAATGPRLEKSMQGASTEDMRSLVVGALVRLVDCPKPDVVIKVGSMLLRVLPAASSMMLTASKMLYRMSKDSSNDTRFRHHGVIRPLLSVVGQLSKTCTACSQVKQQSAATEQEQQQARTTLLYFTGALKNISADAANQKALGRLGAVAAMAQVLNDQTDMRQQSNTPSGAGMPRQPQRQPEAAAQVCVQATAVLRNLAVYPGHAALFVQQQGLPLRALLQLLATFGAVGEVALNVSRCLSKLSLHESCREAMLQLQFTPQQRSHQHDGCSRENTSSDLHADSTAAVPCLLQVLLQADATQSSQRALGLRVAFVLGNLTTYHPEARAAVADEPYALFGMVQLALNLLQCAQSEHEQQATADQQRIGHTPALAGTAAAAGSVAVEDLLVKLLRLLGNTAIDQAAGSALACNEEVVQLVVGVLQGYEFEQQEELVLNAAAALTNLVFYQEPGNQFFDLELNVLLWHLLPLLTSGNDEAVVEAARAVSNLARGSAHVQAALLHVECEAAACADDKPAGSVYEELAADSTTSGDTEQSSSSSSSGLLVGQYVLQALVLLLAHSSWEVVYNVAGALLNLTAANGSAAALHKVQLVHELCEVLQRISSALPRGSEARQQQHAAAHAAAAAGADTLSGMLPAAELVLQCLANMAAMQQSTAPIALPAAASGNASGSAVVATMGWAAVEELMCTFEAQLESDSSVYSSICGIVQLAKTRLVGYS